MLIMIPCPHTVIMPSDSQFWEETILFLVYKHPNADFCFKLNENLFLVYKMRV